MKRTPNCISMIDFLTTSDIRVLDFYISCVLEVDSIRVGALFWGGDGDIINLDTITIIKFQMALRTINNGYVLNSHIVAPIEPQGLHMRIIT